MAPFRLYLAEQGLDAGPLSVVARMRRQGLTPPSADTRGKVTLAAT